MNTKNFIWMGPPTLIELWPTSAPAYHKTGEPVAAFFSGQVATGQLIPVAFDPEHTAVASWLAFGLIKEAPAAKAPKAAKENIDG